MSLTVPGRKEEKGACMPTKLELIFWGFGICIMGFIVGYGLMRIFDYFTDAVQVVMAMSRI
jgi:hypothetical protein